jgi:hypothetical protein
MKTVMFMIFAISMMAFGKTEKVNCTAKSSASLTADTAKVRSLAAHKTQSQKKTLKGKQQK